MRSESTRPCQASDPPAGESVCSAHLASRPDASNSPPKVGPAKRRRSSHLARLRSEAYTVGYTEDAASHPGSYEVLSKSFHLKPATRKWVASLRRTLHDTDRIGSVKCQPDICRHHAMSIHVGSGRYPSPSPNSNDTD